MSSVDVIIPCYRYAHFLRECVESILTQGIAGTRVLILDDASPDNTPDVAAELVKEDARVFYRRHESNQGHIATYNEGLEWASADYVVLVSADDLLAPGSLKRAVALMDANPDVGFTFGKTIDLMPGGEKKDTVANAGVTSLLRRKSEIILGTDGFFRLTESCKAINIVRAPAVAVRTSLQKRVGGYLPELPHTGDFEMWLRLSAYAPVGVINDYQAIYRFHGTNMHSAYFAAQQLPDLQQRKAAIDAVFEKHAERSTHYRRLHQRLLRPLAIEGLKRASAAFNQGEEDWSRQLVEFALQTNPSARNSLAFAAISFKRFLGVRRSQILTPQIKRVRQLFAKSVSN